LNTPFFNTETARPATGWEARQRGDGRAHDGSDLAHNAFFLLLLNVASIAELAADQCAQVFLEQAIAELERRLLRRGGQFFVRPAGANATALGSGLVRQGRHVSVSTKSNG
jgi:hypothetical protein